MTDLPAIAELEGLDQWVAWKYYQHGRKVDKAPVNPHTGRIEDCTTPSAWGSYAQACARRCAGVGFVFHESDPYSGVDLDGCRDVSTGQIAPWAKLWIDALQSYTEISPSGTGVKVFVRGTLPATLTHSMGAHIGIEVYSEKRYFTVTGEHLAGTPTAIQGAQAALDAMWAEYHQEAAPAPARPACKVSPGEAAAGRASLDELKARFHAENTLASLLKRYGATQKGSSKDWSCPFCEHNHTYTLFIYEGRLFSRSPNCRIPQKKGLDAFGLYVLIDHNNDVVAAAKKLNPIARANSAPARELPIGNCPDYLTPAAAKKRQADRARGRAVRQSHSQARMAQIAPLAEKLAASKSRAFVRAVWAYHQHRWEAQGAPEHYDSNERIARSVLGLDRPSTKHERRRLQLAHGRLIERGYLVRTIRYVPGEENTNCWQPGDGHMVIVGAEQTITMLDHESDSLSDSVTCEGGGSLQPDRGLLSRVRELAGQVQEPGWYLRDYAELDEGALLDEADRLKGLREQQASAAAADHSAADVRFCQVLTPPLGELADGATGEFPQSKSAIVADSQIENLDDAGGACYIPALDWTAGGVFDRTREPEPAAAVMIQLEPLEQAPPLASDPTYGAFIWRWYAARPGAICRRTGKPWTDSQRQRFKREAESYLVDVSPAEAALRWDAMRPPRPHQVRRRRAAARAYPDTYQAMPVGEQLQLELPTGNSAELPIGNRAQGFAPAPAQGSPPPHKLAPQALCPNLSVRPAGSGALTY